MLLYPPDVPFGPLYRIVVLSFLPLVLESSLDLHHPQSVACASRKLKQSFLSHWCDTVLRYFLICNSDWILNAVLTAFIIPFGSQYGGTGTFFKGEMGEKASNYIFILFFRMFSFKKKCTHTHRYTEISLIFSIIWDGQQFQDLAGFRNFSQLAICHVHVFSHHFIQKLIPSWQRLQRK